MLKFLTQESMQRVLDHLHDLVQVQARDASHSQSSRGVEEGPRVCLPGPGFYAAPGLKNAAAAAECSELFTKFYGHGALDWEMYTARRQARYHGMTVEMADAVMASRAACADTMHAQAGCRTGGPVRQDCDELVHTLREVCGVPTRWRSRVGRARPSWTASRKGPPLPLPGEGHNVNRDPEGGMASVVQFVLGMQRALEAVEYGYFNIVVEPFSQGMVVEPSVSWNPLANTAMMACCMRNSMSRFPMRIILPRGWETSIATDPLVAPDMDAHYMGLALVWYDDARAREATSTPNHLFHAAGCPVVPLIVMRDPQEIGNITNNQLFYTAYALYTLDGLRVDWGDHAPRKRIIYYELLQVMSHMRHPNPEHRWYAYRVRNTADNDTHILVSTDPDAELKVDESAGALEPCTFMWDDENWTGKESDTRHERKHASRLWLVPLSRVGQLPMNGRMMTWDGLRKLMEWYGMECSMQRMKQGITKGGGSLAPTTTSQKSQKSQRSQRSQGRGRSGVPAFHDELLRQVDRLRRGMSALGDNTSSINGAPLPTTPLSNDIVAPGPHPHHVGARGQAYVDGRARMTAGKFLTPHGASYVSDVRAFAGRWRVIAYNANVTEAVVQADTRNTCELVLLGAKNVAVVQQVTRAHGARLKLVLVGPLLSQLPPAWGQGQGQGGPLDAMCLDAEVVDDYPRLCNLLCSLLLCLARGDLRTGGAALLISPIPRRHGDLLWRMLSTCVRAFQGVGITPDPDATTEYCACVITLTGFLGAGALGAAGLAGLKQALLMGQAVPHMYDAPASPPPTPHPKLDDLCRAAYMTACAGVAARARALAARGGLARVPALARAPPAGSESFNATLPLSWRDTFLMRTWAQARAGSARPIPYVEHARDYEPRCHWGQYKLLASEWDFLVRCRARGGVLRNSVILYVGAAPGMHLPFLVDLFPEVKQWHVYDGGRFHASVHRHPRIRVFEGPANGFVTTERVPGMRAAATAAMGAGGVLLFVCDMRINPDEVSVHRDMVSQAAWGHALGAAMMLLKFRPPYPDAQGRMSVSNPPPAAFFPGARAPPRPTGVVSPFLYLDGEVQMQLFAPMHSTETRLVVVGGAQLRLAWYDPVEYEGKCNAFNLGLRRTAVPDSPPIDLYLPGHDRGYESQEMVRIVREYLGAPRGDDLREVCRMLQRAEQELRRHTGRALMDCVGVTLTKHAQRSPDARGRTALWREINGARVREMRALALARQRLHPL